MDDDYGEESNDYGDEFESPTKPSEFDSPVKPAKGDVGGGGNGGGSGGGADIAELEEEMGRMQVGGLGFRVRVGLGGSDEEKGRVLRWGGVEVSV